LNVEVGYHSRNNINNYFNKSQINGRDTGATGEEYAKYIMDTLQDPTLEDRWNSYQ